MGLISRVSSRTYRKFTNKPPKIHKMTMMYLEDFVELCEDLHGSMRDHLQEISENDKIIEAELTSVNVEIQNYHTNLKKEVSEKIKKEEKSEKLDDSSSKSKEEIDNDDDNKNPELTKLKSRYQSIINIQSKKCDTSEQILKMVEGYLQHLDSETKKFSMDLNTNDPLHSQRLSEKANAEIFEQKEKRAEEKKILKAKEKQKLKEKRENEMKIIKFLKKSEEYDRENGLLKPGIWNYSSEVCKLLLGPQKLKELSLEILIYAPKLPQKDKKANINRAL